MKTASGGDLNIRILYSGFQIVVLWSIEDSLDWDPGHLLVHTGKHTKVSQSNSKPSDLFCDNSFALDYAACNPLCWFHDL